MNYLNLVVQVEFLYNQQLGSDVQIYSYFNQKTCMKV